METRRRAIIATSLVLSVALAGACSKATQEALGEAADESAAERVIEISTSDELRFDPSEVSLAAGEVVEFRITNEAGSPHEFVLGPIHEHGEGMQHTESNATGEIQPGETASVFWSFPESGTVDFACYVAGHNESGMTGTVTVE